MQSSLDREIREHLARYFAGEISLRQFEEWFAPRAWDIHQVADPYLVWKPTFRIAPAPPASPSKRMGSDKTGP